MFSTDKDEKELRDLTRDVHAWSGHDFSGYAKDSFKRRVDRMLGLLQLDNYRELRKQMRMDKEILRKFIDEVPVGVTAMFRDPHFYKIIREEIIPALSAKSFLRNWHAGCSTGEEVFSMAILLHEAGMLQRSRVYATDVSERAIRAAKSGVFPLKDMKEFSQNYIQSGGKEDFSKYYSANYGSAKFDEELSKQILFSTHNLVSDGSFNEFDLVICRNVLIYFNRDLQQKVLSLLDSSLSNQGFLCLGTMEDLRFSGIYSRYKLIDQKCRIWQKLCAADE